MGIGAGIKLAMVLVVISVIGGAIARYNYVVSQNTILTSQNDELKGGIKKQAATIQYIQKEQKRMIVANKNVSKALQAGTLEASHAAAIINETRGDLNYYAQAKPKLVARIICRASNKRLLAISRATGYKDSPSPTGGTDAPAPDPCKPDKPKI